MQRINVVPEVALQVGTMSNGPNMSGALHRRRLLSWIYINYKRRYSPRSDPNNYLDGLACSLIPSIQKDSKKLGLTFKFLSAVCRRK